jgi:hypothetical protein
MFLLAYRPNSPNTFETNVVQRTQHIRVFHVQYNNVPMFLNVHFWDFGLSCFPILVRLFLPVLTDSDEWGRENVTDNSAFQVPLLFADHSHYTQAQRFIK